MRDEVAAQRQLTNVWGTASIQLRNRCEGEAVAGGSQSYVDLLTCIQMAEWVQVAVHRDAVERSKQEPKLAVMSALRYILISWMAYA